MRIRSRIVISGLFKGGLFALAAGFLLGYATPAHAITDGRCNKFNSPITPGVNITPCIGVKSGDSTKVAVDIGYFSPKDASGGIVAHPLSGRSTITIVQCDGFGHKCGTISAGHEDADLATVTPNGELWLWTARSATSAFGHTYKTCDSIFDSQGWRALNVCSPLIAR